MLVNILTFIEIFSGIAAIILAIISMIPKAATTKFLIGAWVSNIISWICYGVLFLVS